MARIPGQYYSIHDDTIQGIADAVRYRTGRAGPMLTSEMIEEMNARYMEDLELEPYAGATGPWTRPADWPDLDSLGLEFTGATDFVYMTYDADADNANIAWHIDTSSGSATVDIGHIESGVYVPDETDTVASGTNYTKSLSGYTGYVVVRITGTITHCYSLSVTEGELTWGPRSQPVLERIAYIPHFAYLAASASGSWGMWSLEREVISQGANYGYALTSLAYAYIECFRLQSLDLSGVITPKVTNMTYCFQRCLALPGLDLSHWDVSKVTNFSYLFSECYSLVSLDLAGWNTGTGTNFTYMFSNCRRLMEIRGVNNFNVTNATNISVMFNHCDSLKSLDVSNWDISKITSMSSVFAYCRSVTRFDLRGWDVSKVTNFASAFQECNSAKAILLPAGNHATVTTFGQMFNACHSVQHLDISRLVATASCTNIYMMFANCWALKELDFPAWTLTGIGNGSGTANSMFINCYSLESITGISNWKFQFTNSLTSMFSGCHSLKDLDVSGWTVHKTTSLASIFANCWSLRELDLSGWAPSAAVTSFASMFAYCYSLKTIRGNLGSWVTSGSTSFASMFQDCNALESVPDLSGWNVAKATTVASMFSGCGSLRDITIKNWNLAACTTIATMFRYCYSLRKATLTGWSIPKVTSTAPGVFLGDSWNLEDVDVFPMTLNHSYANCFKLTRESLLRIINSLPTVTTARTITLPAVCANRLTAAEKATLTPKKWTIAN